MRSLTALRDEHRRRLRELLMSTVVDRDIHYVATPPQEPAGPPDDPGEWRDWYRAEVVRAMDANWGEAVQEPPGPNWQLIDGKIRTEAGLNWGWEDPYDRNGEYAWCGAEAASVLRRLGLRDRIARKYMPSCYRLLTWAKEEGLLVPLSEIQTGDIVIVSQSEKLKGVRWWGQHITMAYGDPVDGEFESHEGNAKGRVYGHPAKWLEGVVRRTRPLTRSKPKDYVAKWVIRLKPEHFE